MTYVPQLWVDDDPTKPVSAARMLHIEDGLVALDKARLIDSSERTSNFDVQAVGVTNTLIDGLEVVIPPQTVPWLVMAKLPWQMNTGTAATGTLQGIIPGIYDGTSGSDVGAYEQGSAVALAGAITSRQWNGEMILWKIFGPNAATRYLRVLAKTLIATPSGWGQSLIVGQDSPTTGQWSPSHIMAVALNG